MSMVATLRSLDKLGTQDGDENNSDPIMNKLKYKKYFLHVYGCQMNVSDAERLAAMLDRLGFTRTNHEREADLIGVVACSVRQAPIDRIYGQAEKWQQMKKDRGVVTILSGCVLDHDKPGMGKLFDIMFPIKDLGVLPQALMERFGELDETPSLEEYFDIVPKYDSTFAAFVPISSGCNKFCSYCAVPFTRGREISRPPNKVLDEVRHLVSRGYKLITILGQNVNSYGWDLEGVSINLPTRKVLTYKPGIKGELEVVKRTVENPMNFAGLLRSIAALPGDFWVRFTSSHPYDMSDELIKTIAANEKLTHWMHLAVQSGSNAVLARMNRLYTIEHYRGRLEKIRAALPDAVFATDIIAGFCGETEEDHEQTKDLLRWAKYDIAYIAQYSPRKGTVSARMPDDVPTETKQRRWDELNDILRATALDQHQARIGSGDRMLVEEYRKGINIGHTEHGAKIHLPGPSRLGEFVDVKIEDATPWHLVAAERKNPPVTKGRNG